MISSSVFCEKSSTPDECLNWLVLTNVNIPVMHFPGKPIDAVFVVGVLSSYVHVQNFKT
jgi:hypothetical protein